MAGKGSNSAQSSSEDLAAELESGEVDFEREVKSGGSGKQRTKAEQVEHKHAHPEGDTRKIVNNILHGEEKRRDEELKKGAAGSGSK
uniref:Uncharacterized protein n=1 Tax=Plectus sambesii TaxID=2011161 RepID=A0A914VU12_9BILA